MSFLIPFDFHSGDQVDGMTIEKPIAHGGHGDLYLVHGEDGNNLILKVIRNADNADELDGIEQCRAVSSHIPGLVPILKTGRLADGRFYCVMPPADNLAQWPDYEPDTLANRIRRDGRIPVEEILNILTEILKTVGELHEAGLSHCDIKPENIIFMDGKPRLTDYTLLTDTAENPAGTIGFIPPEMIDNPGSYSSKACDLYAVGKVLYCAWSGKDVVYFPSVPGKITLREIGIIRPLYMKACGMTPARRFQNAAEFISAIEDDRSRRKPGSIGQGRQPFNKTRPVFLIATLLVSFLMLLASILLFFLRPQGGNNDTILDPLVVTTNSDIVEANDGVTSLREAFEYAQRHGAGATISFAGDHTIRLASPLSVTQNIILDGGENRITLIGPETDPMFHVTECRLTLKNMSLISDCMGDGGGILDAEAPGRAVLISVKDGGKAKCLWNVSDRLGMDLEGGSHLHRVRVNPGSMGANIRIDAGSIMEDLAYTGDSRNTGDGNCDVSGLLKNASVSDVGDIYVNPGGTAENITVKKGGFLQVRPKGAVNGVKVELGGVMGYMTDGILNGTISVGGAAWAPLGAGMMLPMINDKARTFPVIDDRKTDIVFDLTERTETSTSRFDYRVEVIFSSLSNRVEGIPATRLLFNELNSFIGAHSYTIRVMPDQAMGTYLLGTCADKFDSAVSIMIDSTVYHDVLSIGKSFSVDGTVYSLSSGVVESRTGEYPTQEGIRTLILTVERDQDRSPE